MRLRCTVARSDGSAADVLLDLPADALVAQVADVLGGPLWCGSAALDPAARVVASPVVDGARLCCGGPDPAPATKVPPPGGRQVRVVGGPDAGLVVGLPAGELTVGRDADCAVPLTDRDVSRRHAVLRAAGEGVTVQDAGSSNGTAVAGVPVGPEQPLEVGAVVAVGDDRLEVAQDDGARVGTTPSDDGGLDFHRPPRLLRPRVPEHVSFPAEPEPPARRALPVIAVLVPLVFGVGLAVVQKQPSYLAFTLMSPVLAISTYVSDRRGGKKSHRELVRLYERDSATARERLAEVRADEAAARRAATLDPARAWLVAARPERRLWERRPHDRDALLLRVGLVGLPSDVVLDGSPPAPELVPDLPLELPLRQVGVLGVAGDTESATRVARWLALQATVLHSPRDLQLAVVTSRPAEQSERGWGWVRWVPHARRDDGSVAVGLDPAGAGAQLAALVALVEARVRATGGRDVPVGETVLVVLDGVRGLRGLPGLSTLLDQGPAAGVLVVCTDEDELSLPEQCHAVVALDVRRPTRATVRLTGQADTPGVVLDGTSDAMADAVARAMAPLRDAGAEGEQGSLPASVRLLDVLALDEPSPESVLQRWTAGGRSTTAVVGRTADAVFALDLVRDGPHALVAGTTGAGKSELLQTLIASLAAANRPSAMTFVLVDYKGGAAFKDCARLPHTVGMVTDLDGHLVERALQSLTAELKTREHLLSVAGTKDIEDYVDAGEPQGPLPRLVIVIDEFASLVEELPDFVRGLVGIAQRGRSLGVHLVLATQRPGGVVSPEIRANTNLRLALRVTDPAESSDVIDAPDAGRISKSTPGRAYARLGHATLTAFQSARVGGRRPGSVTSAPAVRMAPAPWQLAGHAPLLAPAGGGGEDDARTDLEDLVDAVIGAADLLGEAPPRKPWLPALPEVLTLAALPPAPTGTVPLGLLDVPASQEQRAWTYELATAGSLLAVGSARSGRSTLLRTLATSVAQGSPCSDVHLYGVDCGNGALLPLVGLPHTGAIVTRDQPERVERLLGRLTAEVSRRQRMFAEAGWASVAEQRAAVPAGERLPYLVLLVDRWDGFTAAFEDLDSGRLVDAVLRLLREGPGVGLRIVLVGDRVGLTGRLLSSVETKLAMRLADRDDYGFLGLSAKSLPLVVPTGRAFLVDPLLEVQVALLTDQLDGTSQVAALQQVCRETTARDTEVPPALRPFRVDELPTTVPASAMDALRTAPRPVRPMLVTVAAGGDELAPVDVDLLEDGPALMVGGPPRSGRSTALLVGARSLLEGGTSLVLVLPRRSPLAQLSGESGVLGVLGLDAGRGELLALVATAPGPVVVVVDDGELLGDADLADDLESFLAAARDAGNGALFGGTTEDISAGYRGPAVEARKSRLGLVLCPTSTSDGDLAGVRLPRSAVGDATPGRGWLARRGGVLQVQVPLPARLA